ARLEFLHHLLGHHREPVSESHGPHGNLPNGDELESGIAHVALPGGPLHRAMRRLGSIHTDGQSIRHGRSSSQPPYVSSCLLGRGERPGGGRTVGPTT